MTAAIVLAGGASTRFGSDKTRVQVGGSAVLERVIDAIRAMRPVVDQIVVIGPWAPGGVAHVVEPERWQGPLAALGFGLGQVDATSVLVVGGDHALLEPTLLEHLLSRLDSPTSVDAVVPMGGSGPEPLVACYRSSVGSMIDQLVAAGERSMRSLLDAIDTVYLASEEWRRFDPDGRSLLDVDTAQDLESVQRLLDPNG